MTQQETLLIRKFKIGVIEEMYQRKLITAEQKKLCIEMIRKGKDVKK